jgi:hypothetical protein
MPDMKMSIPPGSRVKVDNVRQIPLNNPSRTWVWAHVTIVSDK